MLIDQIADDLKTAMRAGDQVRVSVLRLVRAAIKNAEVAQGKHIDEAGVLTVFAREIRQRRESIEEFKKGNRGDLVAKEEAELVVLLSYLPQQLSREEIGAAARIVMAQVGATGPGDKGKVMQLLMAELRGKAEGREINEVVTELLAAHA